MLRLESQLRPAHAWGSFRPGARQAAVAAVLYERGGLWHLPFVRRRLDLRDHPGQVALPGGGVRAGEDAWAAGAREVQEELGVPASSLHPLGAADAIYTAVSNFSVVPFVAWLPDPPAAFTHDPKELDGVLEVPLDRLLEEGAWIESHDAWLGSHFPWEDAVIWGLTARMVAGLLPRFKAALSVEPDPPTPDPCG